MTRLTEWRRCAPRPSLARPAPSGPTCCARSTFSSKTWRQPASTWRGIGSAGASAAMSDSSTSRRGSLAGAAASPPLPPRQPHAAAAPGGACHDGTRGSAGPAGGAPKAPVAHDAWLLVDTALAGLSA
jgi:hypothetical protein